MKKLFQILFFVLYPLIIYSQDSLSIITDTTRKPYFESVTFSGGILVSRTHNVSPLKVHLEKRMGKKDLLAVGVWRTVVDNTWRAFPAPNFDFDISKTWSWLNAEPPFSNWTVEVDYHRMLLERKFSLSVYGGYGFEFGSDWYLGTSLHSGFNASYRIASNFSISLGAGARSMYGGFFEQEKSPIQLYYEKGYGPYVPWQVFYSFIGMKWMLKEHQTDSHSEAIKKKYKTLDSPEKLGVGIVYSITGKDNNILHYKMADDPNNYDILSSSGNIISGSDFFSFPYIQINTFTRKSRTHTLGFAFKKRYEYPGYIYISSTETLKSYRFFYQYDIPLLKYKKGISFLYSGLNLSSHIEEFNFLSPRTFSGVGGYLVENVTKTLTSHSNMVSLSLPLGYKKEISSSGVLIDLGLNLDIMAYGYGKYDYTYFEMGPLPSAEISTKGSMSEFIFYPISKNPNPNSDILNYFISCFYFKILFM